MRPPRSDIAAPPLPPSVPWVGGAPPRLDRLLAAGPLLVHFLDFAQLNSLRALPYLGHWRRRYGDAGLALLGVHTPRFPFTRGAAAVEPALGSLGLEWPVAVDDERLLWRAYGCRGWPSLFLWAKGGTLAWYHLGEGEYAATEAAIRETLEEPPDSWPDLLAPLRPTDGPEASVIAPTPEIFPGGSPDLPWTQETDAEPLRVEYEAAAAFAAVDGEGELRVRLDGEEPRTIAVGAPGLVELAGGERHRRRLLELGASPGVRVYSLQFAPAAA